VSEEAATWQGRPARLLVLRSNLPVTEGTGAGTLPAGTRSPFLEEAKIWLDESGLPLALERSLEAKLGPVLKATKLWTLTFHSVDGRLLVANAEAVYSGTALAVMRTRDHKTMKVTEVN
jgi:hypothetical protein